MAHSLELILDADADAAVRSLWRALDEAALPSQARVRSATNRPHVTLLAGPRIDGGVDRALRALAPQLPIRCVIGSPVVFGGPRLTLARLIVPSAELLTLHREVHRLALPFVDPAPYRHCAPGQWTAHVTLGRRLTDAQIGSALEVSRGPDVDALAVGLRRWDGDARTEHLLLGVH